MQNKLSVVVGLIALLFLYFLFWPVPIDPVSWDAPVDAGLVDPFASNDRLRRAEVFDLGGHAGPEDVAGGPDGLIYAATADGVIIRLRPDGSRVEVFAETGGRPLGIEFDAQGNLFVANAYLGVQKITPDGSVQVLVDTYDGQRIEYADDLAVAANGKIYFSDASSKFSASKSGGSYEASLLDILEHGGHGRIFEFDPATGNTIVIADGLNFANGVAISDDQQYLLFNETGHYRVWRYWLEGPRRGQREVVIENLPGFPDNVNNGLNGRFWIGLVAPRNDLLDELSNKPWLRKVTQRLPAFLRPKAEPSSHIIAITGDGQVLMNLQDSAATVPALTGAFETRDAIWLSSLFGNRLARIDKEQLID
ncbi:MAG: SMP-30/gluconolactonase/LRE family protein [Proteobacteria bacterium]|nr:SMP-30/gluconolactonase/LRE family protein [Pseudomonadota bacterium]